MGVAVGMLVICPPTHTDPYMQNYLFKEGNRKVRILVSVN